MRFWIAVDFENRIFFRQFSEQSGKLRFIISVFGCDGQRIERRCIRRRRHYRRFFFTDERVAGSRCFQSS